MRIYILTIDEPFFLPVFFEKIIKSCRGQIVGIGIVSISFQKLWVKNLLEHIKLFGFVGLLKHLFYYGIARIKDSGINYHKNSRFYSIRRLAKTYNIPMIKIKNPNHPFFVSFLRKMDLDIIICQVPYLLSKELLETPKKGCLNRHSSLLPKYRGSFPVFWAMLNQENECGVTVHMMNEVVDAGQIICQEPISILNNDSYYMVYRRAFDIGARLTLEAIKKIENNEVLQAVKKSQKSTYYSFPSMGEIRRFRKLGWQFGVPL